MNFDFAATAAEINKLQDKINQIHSAAEAKAAPFEEELKSMPAVEVILKKRIKRRSP